MARAQDRIRNLKFTTGRQIKRANRAMAKARRQVAKEMTKELKSLISAPYPPASKPGNPPHMRRPGSGLRSKTEVVARGKTLVVKTTQVGIYLEGGTRNMAARPFVNRTIDKQRRKWERRLNTLTRKFAK
ncbi:hypothetical protein LCGC14_0943290 [marine sediment metagenome]|uniref:HK97 gp10 family phage protein n=1 Tax=marine sediment metagenome TaxID=412755 RepID=A0A0F9NJG4_9ZZZZ